MTMYFYDKTAIVWTYLLFCDEIDVKYLGAMGAFLRERAMYKHKVQYYETDKMGITHHSNYIRFMEEARTDFLERSGFGYDRMEREGVISPVVSVSCDYKRSTTYADEIFVDVKLCELSAARIGLRYEMKCGDDIVCIGRSSHCFLNKAGKIISIRRDMPAFYEKMSEILEKE